MSNKEECKIKIEMILTEGEVLQLRDTLDWCGKEAAICVDAGSIPDECKERYKSEMQVCQKVLGLLDLALKEYEREGGLQKSETIGIT